MHSIAAEYTVSISELKRNPSALIEEAEGPIAILNHNKTTAYLVTAKVFEAMLERLEDLELGAIVEARKNEKAIKVNLADL